MQRRTARGRIASGVALAATACSLLAGAGGWTLRDVSDHGPYRAATLEGDDTLRFYFPRDSCTGVLRAGAAARYVERGPFGRIEAGGGACDAVGVGALARWVRRRGRPHRAGALPREMARFELVHQDEAVLLVRGIFPLAHLVFVQGGNDLVAFLPNAPACRHFVAQGAGQLQFSRTAPEVLWFGAGDARCPVLGLATPL